MGSALESVRGEVMANSGLDTEAIFNLVRCGEKKWGCKEESGFIRTVQQNNNGKGGTDLQIPRSAWPLLVSSLL